MELKDAIYGRRSVRKFTDEKVSDEVIKEIINAGMWAPSGVNLQPWYYVVIQSEENMDKLKEMMNKVALKNRAHLEERFAAHPEVVKSTLNFVSNLGNAPVAILAFRDKPDYTYALQDSGIIQSIAASVENMLLRAFDLGVYSCWMTAPTQADMAAEIRDIFADGHGELVCMAVLGYPANIPAAPKRKEGKFMII